ncbi:hypothetical protein OIE63_12835 [Streptomyces sp. NBC_01795]|uniref:hypothetical protein n=1 Tax=Streptomyces sp. NBC_01795 TaxID=2975943 RepID=UPI002DDA1BE4|nr:hypothetical protein [Streptomyces sp. NBC_01795]WSA92354.1 hypothetical protein OIE63_12835 [Streptomyces sp. NBC_01795]
MRSRMIATAAIAAAFVMVPAGNALAGSGPAPAPSERSAPGSTAPTPKGNPLSAKAQASDVCGDAYQIGKTGYVKRGGETIASVKQFYSPECKENYSYVWLWQDFVDKEDTYTVSAGVYSHTRGKELGTVNWAADKGQEYWSEGTDTVDDCTSAVGTVIPEGSPDSYTGSSDKRC